MSTCTLNDRIRDVLALVTCAVFWSSATPAMAATHDGCNTEQSHLVTKALSDAKALAYLAATAVDDTPDYERWFGKYSVPNAEKVRRTIKGVVTAISSGVVTTQCDEVSPDGCEAGTYAWVTGGRQLLIHICPPFFSLPSMKALQPGAARSENGTREGTIIHELTHFSRIGGTDDNCYSRDDCQELAQNDAEQAVDNADSYQYFTEDVTYFLKK